MIISRTPFRVSFAGGGSDLPSFYSRHPGAVVSAATNKYVYVTVNARFDSTIRVSYSHTEIVERVDQLHHELVREAMRIVGLTGGVEITTIADVPAGTGLGSSSSLTVGLLNALYAFTGRFRSAEQLAAEACEIEIERCRKPIGKQDQYAAAYGGLNYFQFNPDGTVFADPIVCNPQTKKQLQERLLSFYIGLRGDSGDILAGQSADTARDPLKQETLKQMVALAQQTRDALRRDDLDGFGALLHRNWELKKTLNGGISTQAIDDWYELARKSGATGGKILGAGGAGFLMLYCPPGTQEAVSAAMDRCGLRSFPLAIEPQGSKIIYVGS